MEGYPSASLPESGDSSPQCREIDGENNIAWDDTPQPFAARVKLMCSYGGRIQPRPHDGQLSYFSGETKILAVDRSVRYPVFVAKLASLHGTASPDGICIKYQLPGEDLDTLITVANDDDLDHMMIEYDRLQLCSGKTSARLRLFLFPANPAIGSALAAVEAEKHADHTWLMETLHPEQSLPATNYKPPQPPPTPHPTLVPDFLSGNLPPACFEDKDLTTENLAIETLSAKSEPGKEEMQQISGEREYAVCPSAEVQRLNQEIQRIQLAENTFHAQHSMRRNDNDEVLARICHGERRASGDQEKAPPSPAPAPVPAPSAALAPAPNTATQIPAAYWADQHSIVGGRFTSIAGGDQMPVYLLYPSAAGQTYYTTGHPPAGTFSRVMPADACHEMPALYTMAPPLPQQPANFAGTAALQAPGMDAGAAGAYAAGQVAYDSSGRAVFYPGGIAAFQTVPSVALSTEPKMTSSSQIASQLL